MKWRNAKTDPPKNSREVIVSDGEYGFAVAWCVNGASWELSHDILSSDSFGESYLNSTIIWWADITPTPAKEDGK